MKKKYKILLRVIFILLILFIIALIFYKLGNNTKKEAYEVVDTIANYNYTLDDRDTLVMKNEFNNLKKILKSNEINDEEYALSLSKLFIIDLFTINNKESKYDVGSLEYVFPEVLDNFKLNVEDTLYKYAGSEKSKFPEVKEIKDSNIESTTYKYDNNDYDAYKVNLTWDYKTDLGYQTKAEIILIKDNNKLYVVSFKGVEEN